MISLVSRKGASLKSPFFRVKFLPARFGDTRVAIITAKKVAKKAVERNKIRRRISYCFEKCIEDVFDRGEGCGGVEGRKKFLIAIFPTAEVLSIKYEYLELEEEVISVMKKMRDRNFKKRGKLLKG